MPDSNYKVLVLARNYPNNVLRGLGLWVKRLVTQCACTNEVKVISPVPYCPPLYGFPEYAKFRRVERRNSEDGVETFYPRMIVGPGRSLYYSEALSYYLGVRPLADAIRKGFDFDIIHAHFSYPDGVAAAMLGRRYGVPVVITEHAPWRPNWMDKSPAVRKQAVWAARESQFQIAVSRSVLDTIAHFTGEPEKIRVIPCGVDGSAFTAADAGGERKSNQALFVGFINFNKGVDILLDAMRRVITRKPDAKLILVGGAFFKDTKLQEERLRRLAQDLVASGHVEFAGHKPPDEVARYMRESAMLVLPSRAESFGAVLVESLGCGTPVVATRCGGPEDIVDENVGVLVPKEDPRRMAEAILHVFERRREYDPTALRAYALDNFSWDQIARRTLDLYKEAIEVFRMSGKRQGSHNFYFSSKSAIK